MGKYDELCGWKPNPAGVEAVINDPEHKHPVFSSAGRKLMETYERKTTLLYELLLICAPDFQMGAQAIGSCVGWGAAGACNLLMAKALVKLRRPKLWLPASSEALYGGGRCEALGKTFAGWSDGSYGAAQADFVKKYGVVQRRDYSTQTGNPEHDLRVYDGKKEKNWGAYGCGGQSDKGKLDEIAKEHPVKTISQIHNAEEGAAVIAGAHCPITIASNYGTTMKRDANGFCYWSGSWGHQMHLLGVRFNSKGEVEGFLCGQSWGPSVASGPKWPKDMPDNIAGWTWWIPTSDANKIFAQGDSWAYGDIDGWKVDRADWSKQLGRL